MPLPSGSEASDTGPMELPLNALTPRMRAILNSAAATATTYDQGYIGTEHVLLALAQDDGGIAGQALAKLGLTGQIAAAMDEAIGLNGPGGDAGNADDAVTVAFDDEPNYALRVHS